ncbi:MAG: hypothetical protein ACKVOJ_01490 [Sphingomonadaceae bacterium]
MLTVEQEAIITEQDLRPGKIDPGQSGVYVACSTMCGWFTISPNFIPSFWQSFRKSFVFAQRHELCRRASFSVPAQLVFFSLS